MLSLTAVTVRFWSSVYINDKVLESVHMSSSQYCNVAGHGPGKSPVWKLFFIQ